MTQLALDLGRPAAALTMCRDCVHRNAPPAATWGYCTPMGWRTWHYEPCAHGFPLEQLQQDPYGRRRAA